jgi:hypothetical protein
MPCVARNAWGTDRKIGGKLVQQESCAYPRAQQSSGNAEKQNKTAGDRSKGNDRPLDVMDEHLQENGFSLAISEYCSSEEDVRKALCKHTVPGSTSDNPIIQPMCFSA